MEEKLPLKDKIAYLLKRKGTTRTDLAQFCKVSLPTVSRWLKGDQAITSRFIPLLAQYFDVDEESLWDSPLDTHAPQKEFENDLANGLIANVRAIDIGLQNNDVSITKLEQNYLIPSKVIRRSYVGSDEDLGVYVVPYSGLEPYLYSGDWVVLHLKEDLPQDGRYVLVTKNGIRFARLHYFVDGALDVKEPVGETYHLTAQQAKELILKTFRIILMLRLCD